jgi:putative intracellular protease/amidase
MIVKFILKDITKYKFNKLYSTISLNMTKNVLVFLAEGAEEMETVITVDTLRRAGVQVTLAGLNGDSAVICSRNIRILPDVTLDSVTGQTFDAVIVPGGLKGAEACATVFFCC